jgi:hypothetical protein
MADEDIVNGGKSIEAYPSWTYAPQWANRERSATSKNRIREDIAALML